MIRRVWYVYPMWHKVSFSLIAMKHISFLKHMLRLDEIDELAFPHICPHSKPLVILHPYFFIMLRASRHIARKMHLYGGFIGIDVADSSHITNLAVSMTHYAQAMIVPSTYAKRVYESSGVSTKIYVVPHGLDDEWYSDESHAAHYFTDLLKLKHTKKLKYILFFLWHSPYRKGWDLVIEFYRRLRRERRDVVMILKTATADGKEAKQCRELGCIHVYGWLTDAQKRALYDIADLYPLFTRGGGFEMCGLEALARLVPTIAAKGGSWEDYMPPWGLVESRPCPYVLKNNPIHDGQGVEIVVEKAVDKAHEILDNLDEYKARLREWRENQLLQRFTWRSVGVELYKIIEEHMGA